MSKRAENNHSSFSPNSANGQSSEENEKRQFSVRDYETLLSLSQDMATIRDRQDLWRVMREKIKPFVNFKDAVVAYYSKDKQSFAHLLGTSEKFIADAEYNTHFQQFYPIKDTPAEYLTSREGNFLWTTAEMAQAYPDFPTIRYMLENGYNFNLHFKLQWANEEIGYFHFHFTDRADIEDAKMSFYKAFADQVAVAVANILANEEILEREREKSQLLSISEQLATIRDKHDLFSVVFERLKPVFRFDEAVIVLCDEKIEYTQHLHTTDKDSEYLNNRNHRTIMSEKVAVQHTPYEEILWNDEPQIYQIADLAQRYPKHLGIRIAQEFGLVESAFMPLRYGGKTLGTFEFHAKERGRFSEKQMPLFKNVADQMAVAVANILANEEIQHLAEERRLRAEELAKANKALARTSERLTTQTDLSDFLAQVVIEAAAQLNADAGHLVTADDERNALHTAVVIENGEIVQLDPLAEAMPIQEVGFWRILSETKEPRRFDIEREAGLFWRGSVAYLKNRGMKSVLAFPLVAGQKMLGVLGLAFAESNPVSERQTELINALANQAALAIQLTKLADEANKAAMLQERNRIAREIHDTLAQSFTGIIVQLEAGKRILAGEPTDAEAHLERASGLAREGLREARRSVQALRPLELEHTDLATTLEQFLDRMTGGTSVKYEFSLVGKPRGFAPEIEANFLRIAQEAVTNALRYAHPRYIKIELCYLKKSIGLSVADDGVGFDQQKVKDGFGLIGMRERARSTGAKLEIESGTGKGTKITVSYRNGNP